MILRILRERGREKRDRERRLSRGKKKRRRASTRQGRSEQKTELSWRAVGVDGMGLKK